MNNSIENNAIRTARAFLAQKCSDSQCEFDICEYNVKEAVRRKDEAAFYVSFWKKELAEFDARHNTGE